MGRSPIFSRLRGIPMGRVGRTRGEIRFRGNVPRDITALRAPHLTLNEVSHPPRPLRLPFRLTLGAPDCAKFIRIASAEISTHLEEGQQHRDDPDTEEAEDEKRNERWHGGTAPSCDRFSGAALTASRCVAVEPYQRFHSEAPVIRIFCHALLKERRVERISGL